MDDLPALSKPRATQIVSRPIAAAQFVRAAPAIVRQLA